MTLFATRHSDLILVVAAETSATFNAFADAIYPDGNFTVERADILDMLGDERFNGFTIAPVKIEGDLDHAVQTLSLTITDHPMAVEFQEAMLEYDRLADKAARAIERRTLAEVHGLVDHDPWDKSTEEQKEANRKEDERMRQVRASGGLTGDSFAAKVGDKLTITSGAINHDQNGDVTGVDLSAVKNTIHPYEITTEGAPMDWQSLWDELKTPESRISLTGDNRAVVMLHDFQVHEIKEELTRLGIAHTITKQETVTILDDTSRVTIPNATQAIYYEVRIPGDTVVEYDPTKVAVATHIEDELCVVFFIEIHAREFATRAGLDSDPVAINANGESIIANASAGVRVIDTNEYHEIGPRPWNDRAGEIDLMTDEEKAEWRKTVRAEEYLIAVDHSDRYRTIVYITPESHFRETNTIWEGELILDMIPDERNAGAQILTPISPGVYKGGLEAQLQKDNMCRWGFVESLLFRIHLNDLMSDARSEDA